MADLKISQLTPATTPLAGTEVLPIVQSGSTVKATIANVQATPIAALSANSVLFTDASKVPSTGVKLTYDGTLLNTGSAGASGTHFRVLAQGAMAQFNTGAAADGRIEYAYNSVNMAYIGVNSATDFVVWGRTGSSVRIGANNAVRAEFQSGGDVAINVGNIVPGTAAKGINFTANTPAAGKTSQLLNWYEEGTFTPTFTNLTVVGTPTYAGTYTRIGRLVYCRVVVSSTTSTASTNGSTYFSSLPFTPNGSGICAAADGNTAAGYGNGILAPPNVYTPTWGASSSVTIALTYTT